MSLSETSAVVFDLDGTLIDAFADITAAINTPLAERGLPTHSVDRIHELVGSGVGELVRAATPESHHGELEQIHHEMMDYYRRRGAEQATFYPGIAELLERLREEGVRIGVLTNKPHDVTLATCQKMGLSPFLDAVQGIDDRTARKPDPQGLLLLMRKLGAGRAVMVGDGEPDGQVARRAGIPFVACLWGTRNREQLAPYEPVAFVEEPAALYPPIRAALELEPVPDSE